MQHNDDKSRKDTDWPQYSIYVLNEMERLSDNDKEMLEMLHKINIDLAMLKGRAITWGSVAGFVSSVVLVVLNYVLQPFK